jgi:hypothetical protein
MQELADESAPTQSKQELADESAPTQSKQELADESAPTKSGPRAKAKKKEAALWPPLVSDRIAAGAAPTYAFAISGS